MSPLTPARLAETFAALPVRVESAAVERRDVRLADYPGGPRPSSLCCVHGSGQTGVGEHVGFSDAEHLAFAHFLRLWLKAVEPPARLQVGSAPYLSGSPYDQAALQAALIDLGLRQAGLTLADLTGERRRHLRVVVSFAASSRPSQVMEDFRRAGYDGDFKIDVDPAWDQAVLNVLAREPRVAVLDFKGRGSRALAAQLAALLPHALLEDPPPADELALTRRRVARDASLSSTREVAEACARDEAVNLKAPRMGGPLAVLASLELALEKQAEATRAGPPKVAAYMGGMFEVSVGRSQAQQLAALFCATSPNDLAPNYAEGASDRPLPAALLPIQLDTLGFGWR